MIHSRHLGVIHLVARMGIRLRFGLCIPGRWLAMIAASRLLGISNPDEKTH